jgi:phospholipid/cholesterol/gamma-HCH transport system ATP-binding protein
LADERRDDPPWGRPLDEPADQQVAPEEHPSDEPDAGTGADAPADADYIPTEEPTAAEAEQAYHDEPGGTAAVTDEPPSADQAVDEADIPDNIKAQTREGEHPYLWHTGRKREHGSTDAVEFIDVKKSFGRNTILNGLNLGLPEGQISMILGPSGTGKSVCIKHMIGLLYPDEGDVLVHGESVPNMADDELFEMRKKFGVLFQDGALFGSMNVFDNTAFPLRQHTDKGEEEITEIVSRRLGEVGLAGAHDKMPNELSGGMRKRAGFARALVMNPDIVLFDEPDSGLDPVRTALLCELIQEVHAENGGCYCVITHDIMSARRVADFIAVLWKGRIVESGPASELFNSDNQFVRQFLSGEAQGPLGME